MRSLATRRQHLATSAVLKDVHRAVLARRASTWSSSRPPASARATPRSSTSSTCPLYVMTSDYGAASQLEKIDMLDFADLVVLNKFDKRGAEDALRDVRKQWRRNHPTQSKMPDDGRPGLSRPSPASSTIRASTGCSVAVRALDREKRRRGRWTQRDGAPLAVAPTEFVSRDPLIPGRARRATSRRSPSRAARRAACRRRRRTPRDARTACICRCRRCGDPPLPAPLAPRAPSERRRSDAALDALRAALQPRARRRRRRSAGRAARAGRSACRAITDARVLVHRARPRGRAATTTRESLSHKQIPKIAAPRLDGLGRDPATSC